MLPPVEDIPSRYFPGIVKHLKNNANPLKLSFFTYIIVCNIEQSCTGPQPNKKFNNINNSCITKSSLT